MKSTIVPHLHHHRNFIRPCHCIQIFKRVFHFYKSVVALDANCCTRTFHTPRTNILPWIKPESHTPWKHEKYQYFATDKMPSSKHESHLNSDDEANSCHINSFDRICETTKFFQFTNSSWHFRHLQFVLALFKVLMKHDSHTLWKHEKHLKSLVRCRSQHINKEIFSCYLKFAQI